MAATIRIDEIRTPETFQAERFIKEYFAPMRISKERKEVREEAAKDFRDFLLFILALIATENGYNALNWTYIEEQFRMEFEKAALQYARNSQALQNYIDEKAYDFVNVTQGKDLSDPYWTSDERATMEAVTESSGVIGLEENRIAEELGAVEKRWRTQRDAIVRDSHRAVDGHKEAIGDFFVLKRGVVLYPGDEYHSKAESAGCRCGLEYLDEDGKVVKIVWTKRGETINNERLRGYSEEQIKEINNIETAPFMARKSVGAMAARFYVNEPMNIRNTPLYIKPGTYVEGVKVIAAGTKIKDLKRLIETYKLQNGSLTKPNDWYKVRGRAVLTDGNGHEQTREIHWYQAKNIGKVEFKFPSNSKQV